jgi:hypothetical protein
VVATCQQKREGVTFDSDVVLAAPCIVHRLCSHTLVFASQAVHCDEANESHLNPKVAAKPKSTLTRKKKPKVSLDLTSKVKDQELVLPPTSPIMPAAKVNQDKDDDDDEEKKPSPRAAGKKSYVQLAHDAILALKDRTGSSQMAIQKYLLSMHPDLEDGKAFRTRVGLALKSGVTQKRFNKFKSSFKVNTEWVKRTKAKQRARDKARKDKDKKKRESLKETGETKKTLEEDKLEEMKEDLPEGEYHKLKEKHDVAQEKQRKKDELEQLRKERVERLKKRRFPMEDTKLHLEDKELAVKPPDDVKKRPGLPYVFQLIRDNKNTAETPSRCQSMDHGTRGMVPDLLQVYHFFRGDVHYSPTDELLVPEFSLQHLMFAVDEILNGNAKKARMVPPLISHLFVTCLNLLTSTPLSENPTVYERRLQKDLRNLALGLGPASWAEICCQYVEAMERYYTTSASVDPNVLTPGKTDMLFLMKAASTPDLSESDGSLPDGYMGYVGSPNAALAKGHIKLMRHDPWNLSGEELMALLRALTDDVLATRPELTEDLAKRDEEMYELVKAKRAADLLFRKMRLAFEGPKQKSKAKPKEEDKKDNNVKTEAGEETEEPDGEKDAKKEASKEWKPTATKKQFESAKKVQEKTHDAYEKGVRKLMARTDPVGFDRFHNRVYYFHHDPEVLYVEMIRTPTGLATHLPIDLQINRTSWHVIENRTMFDQVVASLDIRGHRENDLYETMMGPTGANKSLRRHLVDDVKEQNVVANRKKELEELERKRQNAIVACKQEEEGGGRRSGRFQSQNEADLIQIIIDIEDLEKKIKLDETPKILDYYELTGMAAVEKFDKASKRQTRRSREKKEASGFDLPVMPCSKLWPTGNIDGTGIVGIIVAQLLEVESLCESLCPWQRPGPGRKGWVADLEETIHAWCNASPPVIGPDGVDGPRDPVWSGSGPIRASIGAQGTPGKRQSIDSVASDGKRRKMDSPSMTGNVGQVSYALIISSLKGPLLELEDRIYELTGLARAERDAGEADDNMSTASDDEEENHTKQMNLWKKKVFFIRNIPAKKHTLVRDLLVEAIAAARNAHLPAIVAKLRSALLLHQPAAAGDCKAAAVAVLTEYGGYDVGEASDDEEEDEEEGKEKEETVQSLLNTEAMMITGSLNGDEMANRLDWIEGVKDCKTISRLGALVNAFAHNATSRLEKVKDESNALAHVLDGYEKEQERVNRARGNVKPKAPPKKAALQATEVWADVDVTDEFCMVKLEGSPWWPARKCRAKEKELSTRIASLDLELLSVVGEEQDGGLRVVKSELVRKFSEQPIDEDLTLYSKATRNQLDEFLATSRRIIRGHKKANGGMNFVEEKTAK